MEPWDSLLGIFSERGVGVGCGDYLKINLALFVWNSINVALRDSKQPRGVPPPVGVEPGRNRPHDPKSSTLRTACA